MDTRATRAHLGAELQQRGDVSEAIGAQSGGFDDLVRDVAVSPTLVPADGETRDDGDRQEDGQSDQGFNESHSYPG